MRSIDAQHRCVASLLLLELCSQSFAPRALLPRRGVMEGYTSGVGTESVGTKIVKGTV